MMMFGDRKKALGAILGRRKEDGSMMESDAASEKNMDPKMAPHMAIAEDLHHAIEGKSVMGIAKALKAHHDMTKAAMGVGDEDHVEGE